jgi:hypothetical protein
MVLANRLPDCDTSTSACDETAPTGAPVSWQTCRFHKSVEEIREYPEAQQPFRPMEKILIVEDDQAVQKALKRLFESAGYAVQISGDHHSVSLQGDAGNIENMIVVGVRDENEVRSFYVPIDCRDVRRCDVVPPISRRVSPGIEWPPGGAGPLIRER